MISISRGTPADLDDIVRFQIDMAQESEGTALDPLTVSHGVRTALQNPSHGEYLVSRNENGVIVGSLMMTKEWSDWNNSDYWWIQSVYVRPEFRRQGVFKALYAEARRLAKEAGSTSLRLYVDRNNLRAQRTYANLGMAPSHYLMFEESL